VVCKPAEVTLWDLSYMNCRCPRVRSRTRLAQAYVHIEEVSIVKKNTSNSPCRPIPNETLELWMEAVALVILRRQMRGRWKSSTRSLAATA
jgi:hypothetical protein